MGVNLLMLLPSTHTSQLFCSCVPVKLFCASEQVQWEFWCAEIPRLSFCWEFLHFTTLCTFLGDSQPQSPAHPTIYSVQYRRPASPQIVSCKSHTFLSYTKMTWASTKWDALDKGSSRKYHKFISVPKKKKKKPPWMSLLSRNLLESSAWLETISLTFSLDWGSCEVEQAAEVKISAKQANGTGGLAGCE